MSTSAPSQPGGQPSITNVRAVVGYLVFIELSSGILQGYYMPLYKRIAEHFAVSDADITWFNTVQTLAAAICVPILSKLGDIFGHRTVLRWALISVLLGSTIVALAPNLPIALIGRILVGPIAVWLPLEIGIIHSRLPGEHGRRGIGMLVSSLTAGVVLGSLGGGLTGGLPMTVVLLIPCAVLLIATILAFTAIPESLERTVSTIDWVGFLLLGGGMFALLVGLRTAQAGSFTDPLAAGLLVLAVVLFIAFVWYEKRTPQPAVNIDLVSSRALWPLYLTTFLFGMTLLGTQTITTTFLATTPDHGFGFGLHTGQISIVTSAMFGLSAVGAAIFPMIARRLGMRGTMVLGVAMAGLGNLALALGAYHVLALVVLVQAIAGLGSGLLLGALPALIAELSPTNETGIATGLYNTLKTLGGSIAGAIFAVVLSSFAVSSTGTASAAGYRGVWTICAAGFAISAILLLVVRPPAAVPDPEPEPTTPVQ